MFRKVNNNGDKQHLQSNLDKLVKWSKKWQMLLNFGKCKCLHTELWNLDVNYKMIVSEQCGIAASKGNYMIGFIRKNITYTEKS